MAAVQEYALPDGRTFLLNEEDAKKMGAKPVKRAVKTPKGITPEEVKPEEVKPEGKKAK